MAILRELGLGRRTPSSRPPGLPYGTLKRIELARALAGAPKLLMLDEPASGLTHAEVDELADAHPRTCATATTSPCCWSSTTWRW